MREGVVTPDTMISPMDAANTQQIPGSVVHRIDAEQDPDSTTVLSSSVIAQNDPTATAQTTGPSSGAEQNTKEQDTDVGGLVPTTRAHQGRSNLARRLEGL